MTHYTQRVFAALTASLAVSVFATACTSASTDTSGYSGGNFLSNNTAFERAAEQPPANDPFSVAHGTLFFRQMIGE